MSFNPVDRSTNAFLLRAAREKANADRDPYKKIDALRVRISELEDSNLESELGWQYNYEEVTKERDLLEQGTLSLIRKCDEIDTERKMLVAKGLQEMVYFRDLFEKAESDLEVANGLITKLNKEKEALQKNLNQLFSDFISLSSEEKDLQKKHEKLVERARLLGEENYFLIGKKQELEGKTNEFQRKIKANQIELKNIETQNQILLAKKQKKEAKIYELEKQIQADTNEMKRIDAENSRLFFLKEQKKAKVVDLQRQLAIHQTEVEKLKTENSVLSGVNHVKEVKIQELESKIQTDTNVLKRLDAENSRLFWIKEEKNAKIEDLQRQLGIHQSEMEKLKTENVLLSGVNHVKEVKIQELESQIAAERVNHQREIKKLELEKASLQRNQARVQAVRPNQVDIARFTQVSKRRNTSVSDIEAAGVVASFQRQATDDCVEMLRSLSVQRLDE